MSHYITFDKTAQRYPRILELFVFYTSHFWLIYYGFFKTFVIWEL